MVVLLFSYRFLKLSLPSRFLRMTGTGIHWYSSLSHTQWRIQVLPVCVLGTWCKPCSLPIFHKNKPQGMQQEPRGKCNKRHDERANNGIVSNIQETEKIWKIKHQQGGHSTGKTGNLVLTFSRQGKHREFCFDTGKIFFCDTGKNLDIGKIFDCHY